MKNEVIENCSTCGFDPSEGDVGCGGACRRKESPEMIVYYDDEELDAYCDHFSDTYTPEETEEFRYVLDTMLPSDVPGWVHSLQQRGISLPDGLRDEVMRLMK